jgi:hypothetical protein
MKIRVGTYNLDRGGIDGHEDSRLRKQAAMLSELDLNLIALQDAQWDPLSVARLDLVLEALGTRWFSIVHSPLGDGDVIALARESDRLQVLSHSHSYSHITEPPWARGLACLRVRVTGQHQPVNFFAGTPRRCLRCGSPRPRG